MKNQHFVPMIMNNGARGRIDVDSLPAKDWRVHSGYAKVADEEVHSLQSQAIDGTNSLLIMAGSGATLSVTKGEAEVFSFDYLESLGYTVIPPKASA